MDLSAWSQCRRLVTDSPEVVDLTEMIAGPQVHLLPFREYYTRAANGIWCLLVIEIQIPMWRLFQYADRDGRDPYVLYAPKGLTGDAIAWRYFPDQMMTIIL